MSDYVPDRTQQESPKHKDSFNLRINLFFFSTFLIFCVIIVRLAILQFVEGPMLKGEETSRDVKNVPISPARGIIYDDKGVKLAYSTSTQSMYITLKSNYSELEGGKKRDNYPEVEKLAEDLAAAFKQYGDPKGEILTKEDILKALDLNYRLYSGYIPRRIKMDLTQNEIAYFMEHKSEYQGITIVEENKRQYDPDTVAVQTIGYIKDFKRSKTLNKYQTITDEMKNGTQKDPGLMYSESEFVGFDGLELMYQDELRGKNGYMEIPVDPRNMPEGVDNIIPPEKGHDVWSTINKDVQMKTEQAIMDQLDWLHKNPVSGKLHRDATTGFAVAMEVKTGKIVAMASMPDYDTNVWGSGAVSSDNWKNIEYTYQNGTIRSFNSGKKGYHPESVVLLGSTIKPLSVLIGLKEGFFSRNYTYYDKGAAFFGKEGHQARIQNSGGHVYGALNPATAIEHSSNAFMVDKVGIPLNSKYGAEAIGIWDGYMKDFGLGVVTGSGIPGEQKGLPEYNNDNESVQSRMAYASFGQQGKYTTLQLAQYTATLASEGKRMKPQIVSKITDKAGNVVQQFQPEVLNVVNFDKSYWNVIKKGMNSAVSSFGDFPYDFARKTGTSTQQVGRELVDNGVFIAYAPRENPVLAVAVMIPEGGFGSQSAAPIARKIFDAYDEVYGLDGIPKGNKDTTDEGSTE
ncbi:peptidoglycan D,D-transpeptidase FtsI family protein [Paenibacillus macquariensis]|uniref:Cell division protein FtsI/penicillin-binding protein 2 n=1 Tax=Paenibacillus macquariensis TaxID=948756 RepID=A0ABY1JSW4_9BACL|nr:penicillin-binding transpeptidase domain-containing protein [Paenibacillus macquariensis]MEC0093002.1 penicillin-binding transpeptidase domain-containing protein [Paenibacillus macquariensis]OAB36359.1 cell division protein FtsI [Paenibacillus macquariensis subsp. macquariensis]SIQ70433.1 Cell division protein FtsI/penicillin-binding protein 2 [Paenibacillus macquariensis]